jgi:ketosteroid isomerase-like protein
MDTISTLSWTASPTNTATRRPRIHGAASRVLAFVPDLVATVGQVAIDGDTEWSEWEMRGTRRDGTAHRLRGVILFRVRDGRAASGRFYMEPVDDDSGDVNDAVHRAVVRPSGGGA